MPTVPYQHKIVYRIFFFVASSQNRSILFACTSHQPICPLPARSPAIPLRSFTPLSANPALSSPAFTDHFVPTHSRCRSQTGQTTLLPLKANRPLCAPPLQRTHQQPLITLPLTAFHCLSAFTDYFTPHPLPLQTTNRQTTLTSLSRLIIWFALPFTELSDNQQLLSPSQHTRQQSLATPHAAFRHHRRKPRISPPAFTDHFWPHPFPLPTTNRPNRPCSPSRLVDRSALSFAAHSPAIIGHSPCRLSPPSAHTPHVPLRLSPITFVPHPFPLPTANQPIQPYFLKADHLVCSPLRSTFTSNRWPLTVPPFATPQRKSCTSPSGFHSFLSPPIPAANRKPTKPALLPFKSVRPLCAPLCSTLRQPAATLPFAAHLPATVGHSPCRLSPPPAQTPHFPLRFLPIILSPTHSRCRSQTSQTALLPPRLSVRLALPLQRTFGLHRPNSLPFTFSLRRSCPPFPPSFVSCRCAPSLLHCLPTIISSPRPARR